MPANSITALPSAQLSDRQNDFPAVVARNLWEQDMGAQYPIARDDDVFNGTDNVTDSDYPLSNLYDRIRSTLWKTSGNESTVYLLIDAGTGETLTADCILWEGVGAPWTATGETNTVRVRCSDAVDGGNQLLAPTTITTITGAPFSQDIWAEAWNSSYAARYWEIQLTTTDAHKIQFSQLWLGQQRQFNYTSHAPYDPDEQMSAWEGSETYTGYEQRLSMYTDRKRRQGVWWFRTPEAQAFLRSAYSETSGWAASLWFIEDPQSTPEAAVFGKWAEPGMFLPSDVGVTDAVDKWFENDFREDLPRGEGAGL